jgi:cytochrome c2
MGALLVTAGDALGQTADEGKAIFEEKCASCHTIGGGATVGPDLEGVADRLGGGDAVAEFILAPD